jgi:MSHA biogenesis protein MshP
MRAEHGFAAVAIAFLIVVLGTIFGAAMVLVSSGQQRGATLDLQGSKAYQAARAGLDLGIYQVLHAAPCPGAPVSPGGNLAGFSVNVTCAPTTHDEGGPTFTMYQLTATACNRAACPGVADATYVERRLRATVASTPP